MNTLRNLLFIFVIMIGFSLSVSAQKNDQDKKPPPKEKPPVVDPKPKERPPDNGNNGGGKKPEMALAKKPHGTDVLFV